MPICGHAVLQELPASRIAPPDPMAGALAIRRPGARFDALVGAWIGDMARALA